MENELRHLIGDLVLQIGALRAQVAALTKENERLKRFEPAEGADNPAHPGQ